MQLLLNNGNYSTVLLLLDNVAEVNLCKETGASPLYIACEKGHENTVLLLLKNGAKVNLCTKTEPVPFIQLAIGGKKILCSFY